MVTGAQSFKDDVVFVGTINFYYVYNFVVNVYREWELLLAKLAVYLFELDDDVALDSF